MERFAGLNICGFSPMKVLWKPFLGKTFVVQTFVVLLKITKLSPVNLPCLWQSLTDEDLATTVENTVSITVVVDVSFNSSVEDVSSNTAVS